jgi:hypothetical protein
MITLSDIVGVKPSPEMMLDVFEQLYTVESQNLAREVMDPTVLINFNSLLVRREMIRDLKLLPRKSQEAYDHYHSLDHVQLKNEINEMLVLDPIFLIPNSYPYDLPADVDQRILWIAPEFGSVFYFIAQVLTKFEIKIDDVIGFERSTTSKEPFVRGSFPHVRHLHLWFRKGVLSI